MKDNRPVNLDLLTIKQPLPAIASIIHRISGFLLFIFTALLICTLDQSLSSKEGFLELQQTLSAGWVKLIVWAVLASLIYHLVAGVKHLLMDLGIGETLEGGRRGAVITLVVAAVLIILAGVAVW